MSCGTTSSSRSRRPRTAAISALFSAVDKAFSDGRFEEIDALLPQIDLEKLDSTLLVGVLSITLSAKDKLTNRPALFDAVAARIWKLRPEAYQNLLVGLK